MKKTFIKTVFRDLKKNLSRFIAIIAIVALGVGFLIGLLSATPDLQHSLDVFYDETNTYDIQLKSTIGFSEEDLVDLKMDVSSIDEIEGFYQMDLEIQRKGISISARVIEQTFEEKINQLKLVSGHLPVKDNECIVLNKGIYFDQDVLGEIITIEDKDYEIVGICESAVYYYKLMEPTQIGTGNLDAVYYLPKSHDTITD
ncbi:MAG: ABC transporter permease, partial [Anaeroplasmataceae bacterium]|nr:ABC transporter permease [Anaeroplasmataceae bacterium]